MILHALTIVLNELNAHLASYAAGDTNNVAALGNMAEGVTAGSRNKMVLSAVNIKEERALKNLPNYVRNDSRLTVQYENPPVFLNFLVLMAATHDVYSNALSVLSRGIRFFQHRNVFTQENVLPESITKNAPPNGLDQLEAFKLIFDLYSPTMEEVNHLWGTLGGKQYPFVLYTMRMLELKYRAVESESGLITNVTANFHYKQPVGN